MSQNGSNAILIQITLEHQARIMESINGIIKREDTFRELLSLGHFHVVTFKMITKFSKLGEPNNPNRKLFASIMHW